MNPYSLTTQSMGRLFDLMTIERQQEFLFSLLPQFTRVINLVHISSGGGLRAILIYMDPSCTKVDVVREFLKVYADDIEIPLYSRITERIPELYPDISVEDIEADPLRMVDFGWRYAKYAKGDLQERIVNDIAADPEGYGVYVNRLDGLTPPTILSQPDQN